MKFDPCIKGCLGGKQLQAMKFQEKLTLLKSEPVSAIWSLHISCFVKLERF